MQLFWEKEVGNLARYLMAPMPRPALLLGMALGGMIMTSTRSLIIYLAARFIFDMRFNISNPWLALLVFLATMAALYGMGMTLSSLFFIAGRGVNYAFQSMQQPMLFLGGFYFPVKQLGTFVAGAAAAIIPVTLGLDALRQIMFSAPSIGLLSPEVELMILSVMAVIFVIASVFAVAKLEDLGRKFGKLTVKEQ